MVGCCCSFSGAGAFLKEMSWQISPLSGLSCVYPVMPVNPGHVPVPNVDSAIALVISLSLAATVVLGMHVAIGRWLTPSAISDRR